MVIVVQLALGVIATIVLVDIMKVILNKDEDDPTASSDVDG